MRLVVLLGVLVGCVGKRGGDSPADSSGDSANDPPCELSHPWAMDTVEDVGVAAGLAYPDYARFTLLDGQARTAARTASSMGEPCPTYTESDDGTTITIAGDCTVWGSVVYGGTATFTEVDGSYSSVYDHFYFDDGLNSFGYDVDGTWLHDVGQFTFDLTVTLLGDWGLATSAGATVTYATARTWDDPDERAEGYTDILSQPTSTATGDLCLVLSWQYVEACDSEGDAVMSLQGTTPATLTWDGSTNCDGCAEVTIDGVGAGSYCPG